MFYIYIYQNKKYLCINTRKLNKFLLFKRNKRTMQNFLSKLGKKLFFIHTFLIHPFSNPYSHIFIFLIVRVNSLSLQEFIILFHYEIYINRIIKFYL